MIEHLITFVESLIVAYGPPGVFAATIIEEIIAPIPSALIPVAAGFFLIPASADTLTLILSSVWIVGLPVGTGIALGASAIYFVAYKGGKPLIDRYGKWIGLRWHSIERQRQRMSGSVNDEVALVVLRLLPVVPGVAVSGLYGVIRYSSFKFILITFVVGVVRAAILGILGWKAGELYAEYFETIERFESSILSLVVFLTVVALAAYFFARKYRITDLDRSVS